MGLFYLVDTWPWLGNHTGYHQLPKYVKDINFGINVVATKFGVLQRCLGRAYSVCHGWHDRRDSVYAAAEMIFTRKIRPEGIFHVLYYDVHYRMWERWQKAPRNIIATIHHPPGRVYLPGMRENLARLSSVIVLTTRDIELYESEIGKGRVRFIPHGVDIDFFHPGQKTTDIGERRLLFTGQNGRNTRMLERMIRKLSDKHKDLRFDLLVPCARRNVEGLKELQGHPRVAWHANISDERLKALYQESYLLLQPMESCAANNAIVEALACGLPVVTTDVGGVRDYGGGTIYPVVANDDDDAIIDLVDKYLAKPDWRYEIGRRGREFAERELAWPLIAEKHLQAYKELM